MNPRIKHVFTRLKELQLDGLLLSSEPNISYLSDKRSPDAYLIVSKNKNIYITDSRYTEEAKKSLRGCALKGIKGSVFETIAASFRELGLNRVGFEERHLSFAEYNRIREAADYSIELIPTHSIVEDLRQIKTDEELERLRKATNITATAFNFIREFIAAGTKEIEIAAELEKFIRHQGAYSASFDIIVASGPNSSYPHHVTGERKIRANEPVMIDMGVDFRGIKSDLTRMFFLGKMDSSFRKIYEIVLKAQALAIKKIKPSVEIAKIDAAARGYITKRGFGRFFGHSLGHGIGLEVHEEPHISAKDKDLLKIGMVFTIEPAIYLPGKFGVRIEDTCLVIDKGVEVLSGALNK